MSHDSEAVELSFVQLADTEECKYDAVIIAAHNYIKEMGIENIRSLGASNMPI